MNPIGALIISATVLTVIFCRSKRVALLALITGTIYVTQGQALNVAGLNIFSVRIYEVAGIYRVLSRKELVLSRLASIDKLVIALYVFRAVVYCLRASDSYANEIGSCIDWSFSYLICRSLLTGLDDLVWFLRRFVIVLVPYLVLVYMERFHGQSMWYSMGGVATSEGWTRFGALRCTGSFRHPSLMGSLGASFLALYIAMICAHTYRRAAYVGAISCFLLVIASNSGGPLNFASISVIGWLAWRYRRHVKAFFRAALVGLVILAFIMKAPVWFIIQRISDITGGDGWHRAELIDQAVNHIRLWWLAGMDLSKTVGWFEYILPNVDSADICNEFVLYGLQAGIAAIILLIIMLARVFKLLGGAMNAFLATPEMPRNFEFFIWGLGVLLVGHIFNWLGITYYDQFYMIFALQLSAMVSVSMEIMRTADEIRSKAGLAGEDVGTDFEHRTAESVGVSIQRA